MKKLMREKAMSALKGPWTADDKCDEETDKYAIWAAQGNNPSYPSESPCVGDIYREADRDHIVASNPAAVLALLDEHDTLVGAMQTFLTAHDNMLAGLRRQVAGARYDMLHATQMDALAEVRKVMREIVK